MKLMGSSRQPKRARPHRGQSSQDVSASRARETEVYQRTHAESTKDGNFTGDMTVKRLSPPVSDETAAKILRLLGLGYRARLITVGVETTRKSALSDKLALAIVAVDASKNSIDKIVPLLLARGVKIISIDSAQLLGDSVGRAATTVVGVLDVKLARGISTACGLIGGRVE